MINSYSSESVSGFVMEISFVLSSRVTLFKDSQDSKDTDKRKTAKNDLTRTQPPFHF